MDKQTIQNWREALGWITIISFAYLYFHHQHILYFGADGGYPNYYGFEFMVILTIFILVWLGLHKRKD